MNAIESYQPRPTTGSCWEPCWVSSSPFWSDAPPVSPTSSDDEGMQLELCDHAWFVNGGKRYQEQELLLDDEREGKRARIIIEPDESEDMEMEEVTTEAVLPEVATTKPPALPAPPVEECTAIVLRNPQTPPPPAVSNYYNHEKLPFYPSLPTTMPQQLPIVVHGLGSQVFFGDRSLAATTKRPSCTALVCCPVNKRQKTSQDDSSSMAL